VFDGRGLKRDVDLYRRNQLGDTAFGAGAFPAGTFLAPLLAEMRREFSGINLRVEVSNCTLLLKRLLDEDIEFIVADTQELPCDKALSIELLRREAAAFYVRAGHPLDGRRSVSPSRSMGIWHRLRARSDKQGCDLRAGAGSGDRRFTAHSA